MQSFSRVNDLIRAISLLKWAKKQYTTLLYSFFSQWSCLTLPLKLSGKDLCWKSCEECPSALGLSRLSIKLSKDFIKWTKKMYSDIGPVRRLFLLESCFWLANSSVLDYSGSSSLQKTWLVWNNKVIPRHKFFSLRGPPPLAFWLWLPFAIPKTTVHGKGF